MKRETAKITSFKKEQMEYIYYYIFGMMDISLVNNDFKPEEKDLIITLKIGLKIPTITQRIEM